MWFLRERSTINNSSTIWNSNLHCFGIWHREPRAALCDLALIFQHAPPPWQNEESRGQGGGCCLASQTCQCGCLKSTGKWTEFKGYRKTSTHRVALVTFHSSWEEKNVFQLFAAILLTIRIVSLWVQHICDLCRWLISTPMNRVTCCPLAAEPLVCW